MKLNFGLIVVTSTFFCVHLTAGSSQSPTGTLIECQAPLNPTHQNIVKLSFTDCPEMKTFDALVMASPKILLILRSIAKKAADIAATVTSEEITKALLIDPSLEKRILNDHLNALILCTKDSFDLIRTQDKLLIPIIGKVLKNKHSLFIDFFSGSQDATNYFRATVTSIPVLKELCDDLSTFAKSISISISKDTQEKVKQCVNEEKAKQGITTLKK